MTVPNTLGLFECHLPEIVALCRKVDALLYYDGANLNAILGELRVGDAGFDVVHLNLHKTFATPHGGGGPGSGPVGVSQRLMPFLPVSRVEKDEAGRYFLSYNHPNSIGYVAPFYGNFGVVLKAYAYILRLGGEGLIRVSEAAVLAANYLRVKLAEAIEVPYNRICMHEFVASAEQLAATKHVRALDIAKALLDRGYHAPTIYFPLIVKEALMIEPTETESKQTLDAFVADLLDILAEAQTDPEAVRLELKRVAEEGLAYDLEEQDLGVCAVSAPVFGPSGDLRAVITVVAPAERFGGDDRQRLTTAVKSSADALSRNLSRSSGSSPATVLTA
jgi:glycine dehydrogenase subunit 2